MAERTHIAEKPANLSEDIDDETIAACIARAGAMMGKAMTAREMPDSADSPEACVKPDTMTPSPAGESVDQMPKKPDRELMAEFIAESRDVIAAAGNGAKREI